MKRFLVITALLFFMPNSLLVMAEPTMAEPEGGQYTIGVDDVLEISVVQPDQVVSVVTVSPDGSVSFPYVGNILVKGKTLTDVQTQIEMELATGYMKYPVVSVSLKESRSRKFSVYGEVVRPGAYPLEENTTVLRAISIAGGFNKFGSANRVKLLRPKDDGGYETIKINIKEVMEGNTQSDRRLQSGDIVVVSEGIF